MAQQQKNTGISFKMCIQMWPEREDKNAETYSERIAPTLMPLEEYFERVQSKNEWIEKTQESISKNVYGAEVKATAVDRELTLSDNGIDIGAHFLL